MKLYWKEPWKFFCDFNDMTKIKQPVEVQKKLYMLSILCDVINTDTEVEKMRGTHLSPKLEPT